MKRFTGDKAVLGYHTHDIVDGGKARIILAALVTSVSLMDNTPMLDLVRWVRFRWKLMPNVAVGDTRYGTIPNLVGLEQDGLHAYLPLPDLTERSAFYSSDRFTYLSEKDDYLCPQGAELTLRVQCQREQVLCYRAKAQVCQLYPVKAACTPSKGGRSIFRSIFQPYIERVKSYGTTPAYQKAMRKRQVWVEPLFGEVKQWHLGRHFRLRGLEKANMEGLVKATGQNIKRLLKARRESKRTSPTRNSPSNASFLSVFLG